MKINIQKYKKLGYRGEITDNRGIKSFIAGFTMKEVIEKAYLMSSDVLVWKKLPVRCEC